MDTGWLAVLAGTGSGLTSLMAARVPWLAWVALAPLGAVVLWAAPLPAALAGAIAGASCGTGMVWDRTLRALAPLQIGTHATSWGVGYGAAAWLMPNDVPWWLLVVLPSTAVLVLIPIRLMGAPRWVSNPLACTQERWLVVIHAARRGGDLVITAMLALASAAVVLSGLSLVAGSASALAAAAGAAVLVWAILAWGALGLRRAIGRIGRGGSLRVAAVVADGPPPVDGEPAGLWPIESPGYRDVEAAVRRYRPHIDDAVGQGAEILVLPEVGVWVDAVSRERWIEAVTAWARSHRVAIVAPFFDASVPKNQLVVVDDRGPIVEHEKQHPAPRWEPGRERRMAPGPHWVRTRGRLVPISAVICVDLDYGDLVRPVRRAGGVLVAPSNDWPGGFDALHHRTAVWSAVMTGVPTVRATGQGISAVFDGAGRVLASRSSADGPVVLVADAPLAAPVAAGEVGGPEEGVGFAEARGPLHGLRHICYPAPDFGPGDAAGGASSHQPLDNAHRRAVGRDDPLR